MARHEVESEVTGNVWKVLLESGARVAAGDVILILESMKMESEVKATVSGVVQSLSVNEGDKISTGDELLIIG